jgi:hypothetical protein
LRIIAVQFNICNSTICRSRVYSAKLLRLTVRNDFKAGYRRARFLRQVFIWQVVLYYASFIISAFVKEKNWQNINFVRLSVSTKKIWQSNLSTWIRLVSDLLLIKGLFIWAGLARYTRLARFAGPSFHLFHMRRALFLFCKILRTALISCINNNACFSSLHPLQ